MNKTTKRVAAAFSAACLLSVPALMATSAEAKTGFWPFNFRGDSHGVKAGHAKKPSAATSEFIRRATYPVYLNVPAGVNPALPTVSEISDVSKDGKTLIYTDALGQRIGFLNISNPSNPVGLGTLSVQDLAAQAGLTVLAGSSPTSVAVAGDYVLVAVDESHVSSDEDYWIEDPNGGAGFDDPKGHLYVVKLSTRKVVRAIDLKGQPDSIDVSADGKYVAIAIENQRDEFDNADDEGPLSPADRADENGTGNLPQAPAGFVQIIDVKGKNPASWGVRKVDLPASALAAAGLAGPSDAEPEYITINSKNKIALTLQENNGIAIIDVKSGKIDKIFSAGSRTLTGIDVDDDWFIDPSATIKDALREPDAVAWIDDRYIATANEGDWNGGARGWTVFDTKTGKPVWDDSDRLHGELSIEDMAIKYGLHNEDRADNKGPEIEGLAVATYGKSTYAFVGAERSNFVAVYNIDNPKRPKFLQILATTNGPEGILPIPGRNMLVVSSEEDDPSTTATGAANPGGDQVRASVSVFELGKGKNSFPTLISPDLIGFQALGALSAKPGDKKHIYAANDVSLNPSTIFEIDVTKSPAEITNAIEVLGTDGQSLPETLDIEGIFARPQGGFWLGVEGATFDGNKIVRVDESGRIVPGGEIPVPVTADITANNGIEGVTAITDTGGEHVFVAMQRTRGATGGVVTRIGRYDVLTDEWSWYGYMTGTTSVTGDWIGLSEIVAIDANTLAVIERDKLKGPDAAFKKIFTVTLPGTPGAALATDPALSTPVAEGGYLLTKTEVYDVLPDLQNTKGWVQEKLEGLAIGANGHVYVVTDNDGMDTATGEQVFLDLGLAEEIFHDAFFD